MFEAAPFTRYWIWTDVGDPCPLFGSGLRTVEYNADLNMIRHIMVPEITEKLLLGEWDHIAHIEAHEGQTITDVTRALRAFKPKD